MNVIDIAAEFLRIDPNLVQGAMSEGVINGIFHLFFFPTVFLILFVMILVEKIGLTHRKDFNLLLTVAIYSFIIMGGYYSTFVWLSEWWMYLLLVLGAYYLITYHRNHGGGSGGAGSKNMPGFGNKQIDIFNLLGSGMSGNLQKDLEHARNEIDYLKKNTDQSGDNIRVIQEIRDKIEKKYGKQVANQLGV